MTLPQNQVILHTQAFDSVQKSGDFMKIH